MKHACYKYRPGTDVAGLLINAETTAADITISKLQLTSATVLGPETKLSNLIIINA